MKDSNYDIISLHIYKNSPYKITLRLVLLGYCETNATISLTKEIAYRVKKNYSYYVYVSQQFLTKNYQLKIY